MLCHSVTTIIYAMLCCSIIIYANPTLCGIASLSVKWILIYWIKLTHGGHICFRQFSVIITHQQDGCWLIAVIYRRWAHFWKRGQRSLCKWQRWRGKWRTLPLQWHLAESNIQRFTASIAQWFHLIKVGVHIQRYAALWPVVKLQAWH